MDEESFRLVQQAEKLINEMDHEKLDTFEGLSRSQMQQLLYDPLGEKSPIQLNLSKPALFDSMPLFNLVRYLGRILEREGELKLTQTGRLPTKVVAELYEQKFMPEYYIEKGFQKLYKESDSRSVELTRLMMEVMGMSKKRKMAKKLLITFTTGFNWAYFDGYPDDYVGQMGAGYTLFLLKRYGANQKPPSFYAEKYAEAYPYLLSNYQSYSENKDGFIRCYSYRTFHLFMDYLGLIEAERAAFNSIERVRHSPVFNQLFTFVE